MFDLTTFAERDDLTGALLIDSVQLHLRGGLDLEISHAQWFECVDLGAIYGRNRVYEVVHPAVQSVDLAIEVIRHIHPKGDMDIQIYKINA